MIVILLAKDLRLGQGDAVLLLLLHLLDGKQVAREKDVLKRIVALGLELLPASREKNRGEGPVSKILERMGPAKPDRTPKKSEPTEEETSHNAGH